MPFSASCRPVFVLSNGVLTFVVCHVVDFCDFFKVGQICIERVPLHGFLPVSRTPRHAYRCAASLAGFPLACQSCSILRSLGRDSGRVFFNGFTRLLTRHPAKTRFFKSSPPGCRDWGSVLFWGRREGFWGVATLAPRLSPPSRDVNKRMAGKDV